MSEKQELIKRMLEMQKEFIANEHAGKISPKEYFTDFPSIDGMSTYRSEYADIANQVVNMAHAEKGSIRD